MARRTSQGGCGWGEHPPIWDCSARFASRRGLGEEQPRPATREIPVAERRMVLYATQPKTLSPADPCNKVLRFSNFIISGRSRTWSCPHNLFDYVAMLTSAL